MNDWISADSDRKRDEILRSLGAYLQRTRQSSLTMQDVADQLNISKGTLYNYFKSKQDIVFHCHMKVMEMSLAALREARETPGSAAERLQILLEKHIRGMTDEVYGGVLFLPIDDLEAGQRRKYIELRDHFERGVREFVADGIERCEFRAVDARIASLAILGSINWLPRWYRPDGALSAAELATQFASLFVHSLIAGASQDLLGSRITASGDEPSRRPDEPTRRPAAATAAPVRASVSKRAGATPRKRAASRRGK